MEEIDNTEEMLAIRLSDFYGFTKDRLSFGLSLFKAPIKSKFKDCITVVRYEKEEGKFEEFYTGLSLGYMTLSAFKERYEKNLEDFDFAQAYFELREKGPLFFGEMYHVDDEVKAKISTQEDIAEEIKKEILKIYKDSQIISEMSCKGRIELFRSDVELDLEVAYGENLLYDFQHGTSHTRKISKKSVDDKSKAEVKK